MKNKCEKEIKINYNDFDDEKQFCYPLENFIFIINIFMIK